MTNRPKSATQQTIVIAGHEIVRRVIVPQSGDSYFLNDDRQKVFVQFVPSEMRFRVIYKKGQTVQLRSGVVHSCPDGRENNKSAVVERANPETGELLLERDLHGCKWWNADDVEVAPMAVSHKWADLGVGTAPFACVCIISLPSKTLAESNPSAYNAGLHSAHEQAKGFGIPGLGCCCVCGNGIQNNFVIRDAKNKHFVVGCDCVRKTDDSELVTKAEKLEKDRKRAVAAKKAEAKRKKQAEKRQIELNRQREKNGGLTDNELAEKQRQEKRDARRARVTAAQQWIIDVLANASTRKGDFCDSMASDLTNETLHGQSDKVQSIIRDIYGRTAGRRNSKAYNAKIDEFYDLAEATEKELTETRLKLSGTMVGNVPGFERNPE